MNRTFPVLVIGLIVILTTAFLSFLGGQQYGAQVPSAVPVPAVVQSSEPAQSDVTSNFLGDRTLFEIAVPPYMQDLVRQYLENRVKPVPVPPPKVDYIKLGASAASCDVEIHTNVSKELAIIDGCEVLMQMAQKGLPPASSELETNADGGCKVVGDPSLVAECFELTRDAMANAHPALPAPMSVIEYYIANTPFVVKAIPGTGDIELFYDAGKVQKFLVHAHPADNVYGIVEARVVSASSVEVIYFNLPDMTRTGTYVFQIPDNVNH